MNKHPRSKEKHHNTGHIWNKPSRTVLARRFAIVGATAAIWAVIATACAGRGLKPSKKARLMLMKATAWLKGGDLNRAEAGFSLALEYRPKMAEAVNGLALVSLRRGERKRAEKLFRKALAMNEDLSEAHNNLGVLYCRRGKLVRCRKHLKAALAVDPGFGDARFNLARCLIRMGRFKTARKHLLKVVAQYPGRAAAWAQLALTSIRLKKFASAGQAAARAIRLNPRLAAAHRAAGRLYQVRNAHREAEIAFRKAIKLDGADWQARHYLGVTLVATGRLARARQELERALARRPKNPAVLFMAGFALYLGKNYKGAIQKLRLAVGRKPGFHQATYVLALCYYRLGRPKRAGGLLKKIVRARPGKGLLKLARTRLKELSKK